MAVGFWGLDVGYRKYLLQRYLLEEADVEDLQDFRQLTLDFA